LHREVNVENKYKEKKERTPLSGLLKGNPAAHIVEQAIAATESPARHVKTAFLGSWQPFSCT
jgi:hypothetical protein